MIGKVAAFWRKHVLPVLETLRREIEHWPAINPRARDPR
jgi:hypothetical protein